MNGFAYLVDIDTLTGENLVKANRMNKFRRMVLVLLLQRLLVKQVV